jgi:protein TonB
MPRDLFGSVTDPPAPVGTRSKYSVPLSFLAHVAVIVPLVVIPLMATGALPMPDKMDAWVVPPPIPNTPPEIRRQQPRAVRPADPSAAPIDAPERIEPETPYEPIPFESDVPGGTIDTGVDRFDTILTPPSAAPPSAPPPPVRVGVGVRQPTKVHDVPPVYPAIAREARVDGVVIIEALIDVDGRVQQARVLRSKPLLDQAALDAVRQWQYTPTLLNGQPVPVLMTVTVMFRLQ